MDSITDVDGALTVAGLASIRGRLSGVGSITGSTHLFSGSVLAPGDSPGTLTTGNLTLDSGSIYEWEAAGTTFDLLTVNGTLTFGGAATLDVLQYGSTLPANGDYPLFQVSGAIGTLPVWTINLPVGWACDGVTLSGSQVMLHDLTTPEPCSVALLLVAGFLLQRRRSPDFLGHGRTS